jgi:hypothetical protein
MKTRMLFLIVTLLSLPLLTTQDGQAAPGIRGLYPYVALTFDDGYAAPFITKSYDTGGSEGPANAAYEIHLDPDRWTAVWPAIRTNIGNGVIETTVTLGNGGAAGVVARVHWDRSAGSSTFYACIVDASGWATCSIHNSDKTWRQLFRKRLPTGVVTSTSTLTLAMSKDHLEFSVNGALAGETWDDTIASGNWGLYAQTFKSASAQSVTAFDDVTIAIASNNYDISRAYTDLVAMTSK